MRALGIDFGTSHTVAAVRDDTGATRSLLFDGSPLLPSAVFLDADGRLLAGGDAVRSARLDPARFEPHPKRRIDDRVVLLGDREVAVVDLVAGVLRRVAEEARRFAGATFDVWLSHPAGWSQPRRQVLVDACAAAGLPAPRLVPEPVAAAAYFTAVLRAAMPPGSALAVYDLGGGTFDAAVVRRVGIGFQVLAEGGLSDVGGVDFDQALVEHLGRGYANARTGLWRGLLSPADAGGRRQRALLYDDVRAGKEALSRSAAVDVHLPALDVAAHVTRDELEAIIRPELGRTVDCLARTVAAAHLPAEELVGVFLVGGSSRIPLAARMIHQALGVAPTTLEQPETAVAEGVLCLDAPTPVPVAPMSPAAPHPQSGPPYPQSVPPSPYTVPPVAPFSGAPTAGAPPSGVLPLSGATPVPGRPWYAEPGLWGVVVLSVLVVVAAAVLIWLLATG
jgi:molecular chaperone DnaK (HSP70)